MDFLESIKPYFSYLEDIKQRIISSLFICTGIFFIGFFSSGWIIKNFIALFNVPGVIIVTTSPFQLASLAMDIGIFCATLASIPLFIYHAISFALSAITEDEREHLFFLIPASIFLFLLGFAYGFLMLYYSFGLFAQINNNLGVKNIWDIGSFLSETCMTALLLGLFFQFPLVLSGLLRIKAISLSDLTNKRRIIYFVIFLLISFLPPTDGLSLIAMSLPLIGLYELTILLNNK